MGFFSKRLIDFVHWDGRNGILAHREKESNIRNFSQLLVTESQEAVLVANGEKTAKYTAGKYTIDSANFPLLSELYGLPFAGGENPWIVQVWFVNKTMPVDFTWSTDAFNIFDNNFQASIPICAKGRFGVTVKDPERFILKLCLGCPEGSDGVDVSAEYLTRQMYGMLTANAKGLISRIISANGLGINDISAHLTDISSALMPEVAAFYEDYGLLLTQFYITSIDIDESTEAGRKIREAISSQTAQRIAGHSWQQEQAFGMMNNAINQTGSGQGGLLGAVLMSSMLGNAMNGGGMSGTMNPVYTTPGPQPGPQSTGTGFAPVGKPAPRRVYCSNCSRQYDSTSAFCPHCGNRYRPCPRCGSDTPEGAHRCTSCGTPLVSNTPPTTEIPTCPRCGQPSNGGRFCSACGYKLS